MEISKFIEKLNKVNGQIHTIEEEVTLTDGAYEAELAHDNINETTLAVYTGRKLTGEKITAYTLSTPSRRPWKRIIRIYSDAAKVYISYETEGDTVEAEDVNLLQEHMVSTQISLNEEVDRAIIAEEVLNDALLTEKDRAEAAERKNAENIMSEVNRADAAEKELSDQIAAETARAGDAENNLQGAIDQEQQRAIAAENENARAIRMESERATNAESNLLGQLNDEISRADLAETVIMELLDSESTRAKAAESAINGIIDENKPIWNDKYTKSEVDNKFSALETAIDWKESVNTFADISKIYSNPDDGWTVNVKDTNYTYRYNGMEWIAISANSIPKATQSVDGLLSKEDKLLYDDANSKKHTHGNKSILDTISQTLIDKWNEVSNKVDKEIGKVLSSNDYTTIEKTKLANIEAGAEHNIIAGIKRNGSDLAVDVLTRKVDIAVPVKTSELINDSDFQTTDTTYSAGTGLSLNTTTFNHSNAITAGTAQGDANKTLSFGGTFTIPSVTYDAQGHITGKGTTTMTMPAAPTSVTGSSGSCIGNAATATKATQDSAGQQINTTYLKALSVSGNTITYTKGDDTTGTITTQDTAYNAATTSAAGLMSAADKSKLDGIAAGANNYTHPSYTTKTTGLYKLTVDSTGHVSAAAAVVKSDITALGIPAEDTNTHYTSKNVVGGAASTSNTTTVLTNGNVYMNSVENGSVTSSHKISGSGATTVTTDTSGNIVIASTDNNTTYSAGTGLALDGTVFNHSNSITEGTAQGDASKTLSYGGTFTIPSVTYDKQGHITGKGTTTMTMPAAPTSVTGSSGSCTGNAATATKATQDSTGQQINTTYLKALSVSGKTITYTKGDNSTGTLITQDTTYNTATTSVAGLMSATDKTKLDGIAQGANNYSLPAASSSALGGVIIGDNITNSSGTISITKNDIINALGFTPAKKAATWGDLMEG